MAVPTTPNPLDRGVFALQGKQYWTKGQIVERKATQFASPIRTGNAERADQQFASEVIWDDLSGGLGVINMDERESPDRFTDSSIETRVVKRWMLAPRKNTVTITGAAFAANPSGAVTYGGYTYVVGGTAVKRLEGQNPDCTYYDTGTSAWVSSGGTASRS